MSEGLAIHNGNNAAVSHGQQAVPQMLQGALRETAVTSAAVQAEATIRARYMVALSRPRDLMEVRAKLLKECMRPGFADTARFSKPIGRKRDDDENTNKSVRVDEHGRMFIEGPSIRFAEAAIRCMGNIETVAQVLYDDPEKRLVRVTVTDMENNVPYAIDLVVSKTVERRKLTKGQQAMSTRTNSYGDTIFLLPATDDQVNQTQGALISKATRTLGLRHLPGDIIEECMWQVLETQKKRDAQDPDAAKKRLLDSFASVGVNPRDLAEFLGHDCDKIVAAELIELRAIYSALSENEITWKAVLDAKLGGDLSDEAKAAAEEARGKVSSFKARLVEKQAKDKEKKEAARGGRPASPQLQDGQQNAAQQTLINTAGQTTAQETVPAERK